MFVRQHHTFRNIELLIHIYGASSWFFWPREFHFRTADLELEEGESAWNPKSDEPIRGPMSLTYTKYYDGEIECKAEEVY